MKNLIGSNQFITKRRNTLNGRIGTWVLLTLLSFAVAHYSVIAAHQGISLVSDWARHTFITTVGDPVKILSPMAQGPEVAYADEKVHIRVVKPVTETEETPGIPVVQQEDRESSKEIEAYMRTIFGKDAPTAIAIAKAESGLRAKANNTSKIETSIGVMQINIKSKTTLVHWSRIPGKTLEEKVKWLEVPEQNILLSYWIFSKSGFSPWSTYQNGAYLKYL